MPKHRRLNKSCHIQTIQYYGFEKKNEKDLYELIQSEFHDIMLNGKSRLQKNIVCYLLYRGKIICSHIYLSLQKETHMQVKQKAMKLIPCDAESKQDRRLKRRMMIL